MTECQGCGAWNDSRRTLCVLCGTPLAETDEWEATAELPPLPPLPDGGLRATMPAWLREPPAADAPPATPPARPLELPVAARLAGLEPLGPAADPRTFLNDDDFPRWLRELAARRVPDTSQESAPREAAGQEAPAWPDWPAVAAASEQAAPALGGAASLPVPPPVPLVASNAESAPAGNGAGLDGRSAALPARAREERGTREPWETLLLVLLFIGVVVAALWALISNGVFSPAL